MTADDVSVAAGDAIDPTTLAKTPEEAHADDTAPGEAMDTGDAETTEKSNLKKSHILVRFASDGKPLNVAILLKVLQWLFKIDPAMHLETNNADWKAIKSMNDFPNKEVDFMKCFDPTHNRVGGSSAVIGIHLFSTVSIGLMKKNNTSFMQCLKSKKIGIKTSCGGSKTEVLVCGLLGFNPDKVHRASLTTQIHDQLVATNPDLAEQNSRKARPPFLSTASFPTSNSSPVGSMRITRNTRPKASASHVPPNTLITSEPSFSAVILRKGSLDSASSCN
jgi:hypothetical protein